MSNGRKLVLDPIAETADPNKPAFIARPTDSPVYHGFVIVPETYIDGWVLGEITAYIGAESGDGFVVAPDGSRAGLVWEVGDGSLTEVLPPEPSRWGVYAIWFPYEMRKMEDLISNFRSVLPVLKMQYAKVYS
jgi:hypothetical protein